MTAPDWALSLAYWLHLLATVVWIGGLTSLALIVLPAARKSLELQAYARFLNEIQRRFDPQAWFGLLILAGTGLFQMSANPNYQGFLAVKNSWAIAILVKHGLFLGMAGVSAYMSWGVLPRLRRLALLKALSAAGETPKELGDNQSKLPRPLPETEEQIRQQEARLFRINLVLGVLVLALTAIARAA